MRVARPSRTRESASIAGRPDTCRPGVGAALHLQASRVANVEEALEDEGGAALEDARERLDRLQALHLQARRRCR